LTDANGNGAAGAFVRVRGVSKWFGDLQVLDNVDLDVGEAMNGADAPTNKLQSIAGATTRTSKIKSDDRIKSDDTSLPEMEPVTMSEVGTKLDLARAYMDMGDPEGARSILEEVVHEGSASQKQEAQRLIETLPG